MRAVDTNVIVRLLIADEPDQLRRSKAIFNGTPVYVAPTVLLEAVWVLSSTYGYPKASIARAIRDLFGLPGVQTDASLDIGAILGWVEGGMGFADAIHLASAQHCDAFLTFDRALIRAAAGNDSIPVAEPPPLP